MMFFMLIHVQPETRRKRIVAYDDDAMAIRDRYARMARDSDVQLVYFWNDGDEQRGRRELEQKEVPTELANLATVINKNIILKLALGLVDVEQSGIPFPQEADQYFIDGLNYFRNDNKIGYSGFVPIASRLPKDRVTIVSSSHKACDDAVTLGYKSIKD